MALTGDYQLELRSYRLGDGSDWDLLSLKGLGVPSMRTSDVPRPIQHGEFVGLDLLSGRTLEMELETRTKSETTMRSRMEALAAAFKPAAASDDEEATPLDVQLIDSAQRRLFGRPRRLSFDVQRLPFGVCKALVQYRAQDPRLYAVAQSSVNVSPPVASVGRTYDRTYPLAYGAGTSGTETAENAGTFETFPTWTLNGPLTNPYLENVTTGKRLDLTLTLLSGESLAVDFKDRTILLGGTASRYSALSSGADSWWALEPGNNEVRLGADSGSGDADMTWRSAWL